MSNIIGNRKPLKTEGHLSRDPRAKERRKYGLNLITNENETASVGQ